MDATTKTRLKYFRSILQDPLCPDDIKLRAVKEIARIEAEAQELEIPQELEDNLRPNLLKETLAHEEVYNLGLSTGDLLLLGAAPYLSEDAERQLSRIIRRLRREKDESDLRQAGREQLDGLSVP